MKNFTIPVKLPLKHGGGGHWIFRCQGIEKSDREVRKAVLRPIVRKLGPHHQLK